MTQIESQDVIKAPAFQFYPKDFLSDENVRTMSMAERGVYITMLSLCWIEGSLPSDVERLARLYGVPVTAFRKAWPAVLACFRTDEQRPDRLVHPRLEKEREKQAAFKRRQSDKGKASAASRQATVQPDGNRKPTAVQPEANREDQPDGNSSSLSSSSSSSADSGLKTNTALARVRDEGFEAFWQIYPKRRSRGEAEKAWKKIRFSPDLVERIIEAVRAQRQSPEWQKDGGQFIPYPASWLNAKRWEDETDRPAAAAMGSRTLALVNATAGFLAGGKS